MLALPVKMQKALDDGNFEPVTYAEIITAVQDVDPVANPAIVVNGSGVGNTNITDTKNVILNYPAAVGDPTQTETLIRQGFINQIGVISLTANPVWGIPLKGETYQTFAMGDSENQGFRLKSITITLSTGAFKTAGWMISGSLLRINKDRTISGRGGSVPSSIIPLSSVTPTPSDFTFTFDDVLIPGGIYAFFITRIRPQTFDFAHHEDIIWHGSSKKTNLEEESVSLALINTISEGELSLKVDMAAYSYNGTIDPWAEYQLDMTVTPLSNGNWSFRDQRPAFFDPVSGTPKKTDIEYTAWSGASLGAKTTSLGVVKDGDTITTLSQFYVVRATLRTATTSTLMRTPNVKRVNAIFPLVLAGASKVYEFSSHPLPFTLAPAIQNSPSIATKLDPRNHLTARGSFSLKLADLDGIVTQIATEENLLNLPVEIRLGHRPTATSKNDLALVATGRIRDYSYVKGVLTLKIEDRTKQLDVKIPKPQNDNIERLDYQNQEIVTVLEDLLANQALISRRWIDTGSFSSLSTFLKGSDTVSLWLTHRVIDKPTEAKKLVNEILQLVGAFLVPLEDGKLRLIQFPRSGASVGDPWDEDILSVDDSQPGGFDKSIVNQSLVLYDKDGDGKNRGVDVFVDADAQDAWSPGSERAVFDRTIETRWLGPEAQFNGLTVSGRISKRTVDAHKNGMVPYKCRTGLDQFAIQIGDFKDVTSPVFLRKFKLGSTARQFMVISKDPKFDNGFIDWVLIEVIQFNRKPTAIFTATPIKGLPTLNVTVNGTGSVDPDGIIILYEWDKDYDGVNFQVDATGATPAALSYDSTSTGPKTIAFRVTDDNGAVDISTKTIKVLAPPVSVINYALSAPDQPLFLLLSSASYGVTGLIVKSEWDLSYDGVTFNLEVVGGITSINTAHQTIRVALRVTDENSLTNISDLTFNGKTIAPADVIGFFVDQARDRLVFNWNPNLDIDIFGYEIRKGLTWNNSVSIEQDILANHFMTQAPLKVGSHTYLIKAYNTSKDTLGRGVASTNAASVMITTFDTKDRNIVVTADRKAAHFPNGVKTGLVHEVFTDKLWIDATDDLTEDATELTENALVNPELRGTRVTGSYEGPPVDAGSIIDAAKFDIQTESEIVPDPLGTTMKVEYAQSDDGSSYTTFAQIRQGERSGRFWKEKITLTNDDGSSNIALTQSVLTLDAIDIFERQENVVIAVGGTIIVFKKVFNVAPTVTGYMLVGTGNVGVWLDITARSKTQMTVVVRRMTNDADVGGTLDFGLQGY